MLSLLCATIGLMGAAVAEPQDKKPTYFVFLVGGKNPPQATQEELTKYQTAHIDNFKRLAGENKILTAGPCADPAKVKRGIVIFTTNSKDDVKQCFAPDPYVSKGFMDIQTLKISPEFGKINTSNVDPESIVENRIVVFTAGAVNPDSASVRASRLKHLDHIKLNGGKAGLAFYASVLDSADIRAIALFRGTSDKDIQSWLSKDPLVKNGTLKATKMKQWLSKGVL